MIDPTLYGIQPTSAGVIVKVYVTPRASANKVAGKYNGALKVLLAAPPSTGGANKALLGFMSRLLGVPKSAVSLISGETSRHKVVQIVGVSVEEVLAKLESRD